MAAAGEIKFELDGLYWMAVMQLQHERRRLSSVVFNELLTQALAEFSIDRRAFQDYVEAHREDLQRTIETVGV
jgi:hypothetical protein